jgi:hypothetical protein
LSNSQSLRHEYRVTPVKVDVAIRLATRSEPLGRAFREIPKFCAKQQGRFVRCVSASPPGSVGLQLPATSRLRPSELFPVPALLRCHRIRNSIGNEVRAGAEEMTYEALLCSFLPSTAR